MAGIKPNIIILMTVLIGYRYGKIPGILMGFLTGLLLDMTEGEILGYFALLYLLVGYLNGFANKFYHKDHTLVPLFLIAVSDLSLNLMIYISSYLVRNRLDFLYYFIRIILPELIYTIVISALIYKALDFIFQLLDYRKPEVKEDANGGNPID